MIMKSNKAAVFILLGQSNAVGHGVPMKECDIISEPLKNVFGLKRKDNQSFDSERLVWSGYTSAGTNLAEEQDNTYSVANCLASLWQKSIDNGEELPDLHIIQIAIGAEGVTEGYMWHPEREPKLVPGKLGKVDISLFPFSMHIFSLLDKSFLELKKDYEIIGIHWRGGENDVTATKEVLEASLFDIYSNIFGSFCNLLGEVPIALHKLIAKDRMYDKDPSGAQYENMLYIDSVFEQLASENENITVFDPAKAPQFVDGIRGNGIFLSDCVHFTPEVNKWVAEQIITDYLEGRNEKY